MGVIEKYVVNQASKAIDKVQGFGDKLTELCNRVQGYAGTAFEVAKNGSTFVGIQYTAVPGIRTAIRNYVTNVQTELDKLNTEASSANALKGEDVVAAAAAYVKAVDDVAKAYTSSLLAYSDKMYEYAFGEDGKGGLQAAQANLASNVTDEADKLSSSVETYTLKHDDSEAK